MRLLRSALLGTAAVLLGVTALPGDASAGRDGRHWGGGWGHRHYVPPPPPRVYYAPPRVY
jgi:hypothetical protein